MRARQIEIPVTTQPGFAANRYYASPAINTNVTTFAPAANVMYAVPFYVSKTTVFTRIGVEVTVAVAGSARLGIYTNLDNAPSALVLDAGEFSHAGTGNAEITISQPLSPGWYWLVLASDATSWSLRGGSSLSNTYVIGKNAIEDTNNRVSAAFTYGVLPAAAPAVSVSSATAPNIWLRVA